MKLTLVVRRLTAQVDACDLKACLTRTFDKCTRQAALVHLNWWSIAPRVCTDVEAEMSGSLLHTLLLSGPMLLGSCLFEAKHALRLGLVSEVTPQGHGPKA